ncbi:MAG TPA: sigma-54 dependent transcriptional regulator [Opitutaceae bacterium]|nr:sigma-54 dependent transcriptional regulator [Opitutaceae bacterium]
MHFGSAGSSGPFVAVNCSALPVELAESQLFGHVRGAFTGATMDHKGYFELAHNGTLFLDELGDMPLGLQAKLLRVLEDNQVTPVGATNSRRVAVRVIAATNVDLPGKIAEGKFREDLYYRLMHYHVHIPPLRERREDIPSLAAHFVKLFATELKRKVAVLRPGAIERLLAHTYPGNIRELKNTIERAIIYAGDGEIHADHIIFAPQAAGNLAVRSEEDASDPVRDLPFRLDEAETCLIKRAITAAGGNLSAAARLLGVNRARLYRWQERTENASAPNGSNSA